MILQKVSFSFPLIEMLLYFLMLNLSGKFYIGWIAQEVKTVKTTSTLFLKALILSFNFKVIFKLEKKVDQT